jgi:prepilin-type N-terminal cleavage/methylation domain-containing protein
VGGATNDIIIDMVASARRNGFTLIELLVVIAVIAILTVVVLLTLNPAELLRQSRDSNRLSDLDTMVHALGLYTTDQSTASAFSLGSSNVIYISIPDSTATSTAGDQCQGLGLPTLPVAYSYHCASPTNYRNVDGTGWIPVNFKAISSGAPLGNLPADPTDQSSSRLYYSYAVAGTQFELTAGLEAAKYKLGGSNDAVSSDGGIKATVVEKGTNLLVEPMEYGDSALALYWSLNEGTGTVAYDYSGGNATGSWNGTPSGSSGYYSVGKIGPYGGSFLASASNYISTGYQYSLTSASNFTWSGWMNYASSGTANTTIIGNRFSTGGTWIKITPSGFEYGNGMLMPYTLPTSTWVMVTITKSGTGFTYYLNGTAVSSGTSAAAVTNEPFFVGGDPGYPGDGYINGQVDDVRLYTRALSAAEVKAMYASQK